MHKIAGLRNPWNSCGPEVSQQPENNEDEDEKFEHERFLSKAATRLTNVPLLVPLRRPNSTRSLPTGSIAARRRVGLIRRQNLGIPCHFPEVTIGILEVPSVASPEGRTGGFDDRGTCAGCPLHEGIDLLACSHVVSERQICGATRLTRQSGVAGNAGARPQCEDESALQLEEGDCPVFELAADVPLLGSPRPSR